MIYSIAGKLVLRKENFAVVETGGVGYKIYATERTLERIKTIGESVRLFCHLYVREDRLDLYGFLTEQELRLFELFNSVAGVGPKSAMGLLDIDKSENLIAAIAENRPDLLTRVSGIGRKTAERIILELKNKIGSKTEGRTAAMEADIDVEEALVNLGYPRRSAREALEKLPPTVQKVEERLKEALKMLGKR